MCILLFLKEHSGTADKDKKSSIFTRDRTMSSNKYKKSQSILINDSNHANTSGVSIPVENIVSMAEVCWLIKYYLNILAILMAGNLMPYKTIKYVYF